MTEDKRQQHIRSYTIAGLFLLIILFFIFVLFRTQIIRGDEYRAKSIASNAASQTVTASRGVITDRNGKILVTNRVTYTLKFDSSAYTDDASLNSVIIKLFNLFEKYECSWVDTFPISKTSPYTWASGRLDDSFLSFLEDVDAESSWSSDELLSYLTSYYHIDTAFSMDMKRQLIGVRYELTNHSSYVFSEDVSVELISEVLDANIAGVTTGTSSARVYSTSYASHLLGRVSRIYAEDWEEYRDLGYSMNAIVGESGVEKAFESYLAGKNGTRLITTDRSGNITGELYTVEPQPGATVSLTLDIDLQAAAEEALATTIEAMQDKESDTRGGAAVVIDVGSGEILALASYPSYDLSTYSEDYANLIEDPRLPLFNRAVNGTYAPGSTFKMVTAIAALENGIITPETTIYDKGVYTYYTDPQPMCWLWRQSRTSHGDVNVTKAIEVSCNYFFYEVGRLTGIENINSYASQFGLGSSSGIEIGDASGSLASQVYASSHDLEWSDGQTLTAAIGQSYNLFTPIQLANYIATLVGDGEHYPAHLLKSVKTYDNSSILYVPSEQPTNIVEMDETSLTAVLEGMYNLTQGSLISSFSKCNVTAGAKTGSAQVGTDIANGVFVAFAPYENPEIALAIVIEKGGSGAALASTAVSIINAYFDSASSASSLITEGTLLQ